MPKFTNTPLPAASGGAPWGYLPSQMRVLFIAQPEASPSGAGWLEEAFHADGASRIEVQFGAGMAAGLACLREERFDAVLIRHQPPQLDALELLEAIRAGDSDEQPLLVLGDESECELDALCYEAGGDGYLEIASCSTRTLIWRLARAVERRQLVAENRQLRHSQRQRLELDHDEASRLLEQQRAMIDSLESLGVGQAPRLAPIDEERRALPDPLVEHYRELLRTYVIMGSGNLAGEMSQLAELLVASRVSAHQAMLLHVNVLEELVQGLGSRSARHVMTRADMLILEVMISLADGYRQGSGEPQRATG